MKLLATTLALALTAFGLIRCSSGGDNWLEEHEDSLCADARRIAIEEFNNNDFLIRDTSLERNADYAEEIFFRVYQLKPSVWHSYSEFPCVIPKGGFPRSRPCYRTTIDSLVTAKCGPDIYVRIKKSADSLQELYPDRYADMNETVTECWYAPTYIPNNDSLNADLRKLVKYPPAAIRDNVFGVVYVRLHIDSTGKVFDATIARGVRKDLDSAAMDAALHLGEFETKNSNGEREAGELVIPIKFVLK